MHREQKRAGRRPGRAAKKDSVQGRVIEAVRHAIFSGAVEPGDPVLELPLAREHRVSQTTVREALAKLEHAGFVRRIPNKGTFVTKFSPQELREHIRLRVLLESIAAVEAAQRMAKDEFVELEKRLEDISRAIRKNAYFELVLADLEFHRYIWARCGDRTLYRVLDQLTAPLFAFTSIGRSSDREDLKRVVKSHEPIIAALRRADAGVVKEAIRLHIERSYARFLNVEVSDLRLPKAI